MILDDLYLFLGHGGSSSGIMVRSGIWFLQRRLGRVFAFVLSLTVSGAMIIVNIVSLRLQKRPLSTRIRGRHRYCDRKSSCRVLGNSKSFADDDEPLAVTGQEMIFRIIVSLNLKLHDLSPVLE